MTALGRGTTALGQGGGTTALGQGGASTSASGSRSGGVGAAGAAALLAVGGAGGTTAPERSWELGLNLRLAQPDHILLRCM